MFGQKYAPSFNHLWSEMLRAFASASVLQVTEDPQKKGSIESGKNEKLSLRERKRIFIIF